MSPASALASRPVWKTKAESASDASSAPQIQGRQRDQVPQRGDGLAILAVRCEPLAERDRVERRISGVEPSERERRARGPDPAQRREPRVARERAGQLDGSGQVPAAQYVRALAGSQNGDLESLLKRDELGAAEPLQQRPVGGAAAQEHMLAVVHLQPVALEGVGRAPEPAPHLDERDRCAGLGAVERRGDPGEPAPDHQHASHAGTPISPRTATSAFSWAGSDTRPARIAAGSASIRSSRRR